MKNAIATLLQFVLFLFVFGVFSLFPLFHMQHVISSTPISSRIFVADGLVLVLALYIVILLIEAAMKRLTVAAPWTSLAFVLALVLGFMMKFGFLTNSTF
jgi:hypothetical protein